MRNYIREGKTLEFTAASAITSGSVVVVNNKIIGIAAADIAANTRGTLAIEGIFRLTKLGTDVVAQGDALYWDGVNSRVTITPGTILAGHAAEAAGSGATTVEVNINEFLPNITSVGVTVAAGATSGASAADVSLVNGQILGIYSNGNQDQFVNNVVVNANGSITVTLRAAATANNVFRVVVLRS